MAAITAITLRSDSKLVLVTRSDDSTERHLCHDVGEAETFAARLAFKQDGWEVTLPCTGEGYRLPLLAEGESLKTPLDGTKPRARGFTARKGDTVVRVDACAGYEPKLLKAEGPDLADAVDVLAIGFLGLAADLAEQLGV